MKHALHWVLFLLLIGCAPLAVFAEDAADPASEDDDGDPDAVPVLREAEKDEAKPLIAALKKAYKEKDSNKVRTTLASLKGLKHKDFIKPLVKLMSHKNARAAAWAGEALEHRASKGDIKTLWKKGWGHKDNVNRYTVRTKVLRIFARLEHDLDKKQFADVCRVWTWMIEKPHQRYGPALADICWYFGERKDKRFALKLAHELNQPGENADPNDGSTPPVEWWEKRVKMWQGMHSAAVEALEKITGKELTSVEAAKKWFKENEKTFGVKWTDSLTR